MSNIHNKQNVELLRWKKTIFSNNFVSIEMSADAVQTPRIDLNVENQTLRRDSVLSSSNPHSDYLPIDFILVYDPSHNKDIEFESNNDHQLRRDDTPADCRRKFEEYLRKKHGLILEPAVRKINILIHFFRFFMNRSRIQIDLDLLKFILHLKYFC